MSDTRIVLQWGPKEIEDLRSQLEEIRNALQNGADDNLWVPGMTLGQAVKRLTEIVYDLRYSIDNAPCLAAKPGEMTYECRIDNLCRVCSWRSEALKAFSSRTEL